MLALRHVSLACPMLLLSLIACDRSQLTAPSLEVSATSAGGPTVKAPSSTGSSAVSPSQIDVSWQDNSSNETGFEVHRSTSGPSGTFALRASTGANITTYADAGLASSTPYCYKVRAFRTYDSKTSYSDFSNTACATTPTPPVPAAPWLQAEARGANWLWFGGSGNADGFEIERCEGITCGDAEFGLIATTGSPYWSEFYSDYRSSYADPAVALGTTYTYRVRAFNRAGYSAWSNLAEVTAIDGY